jgi:hypothetical protein
MKLQALLSKSLNQSKPISLAKLRRKAESLGLTIEIDRVGRDIGYWLDGTGLEDDNFCANKQELEYKLDSFSR